MSQFISKNRNPCIQFFVTFPHSTCDKISFRDTLSPDQINWYMIAEEKHKDGTPHLHAIFKMKKKITKSQLLKIFKEKFPNDYKRIDVGSVRSIKNAIDYLGKEDPAPLKSGDYIESRNPSRNFIAKFVRENYGYDTLEEYYKSREAYQLEYNNLEQMLWKAKMRVERINPEGYQNFLNSLEWEKLKYFRRFLEKIEIPKDDMTFFVKSVNSIL